MKTRAGFVSNSSSSSFVVALKKGVKPKLAFSIEVDISRWGQIAETLEELDQAVREEWQWTFRDAPHGIDLAQWLIDSGEGRFAEWYTDAVKAIEEGKTVVIGSVANDYNDDMNRMIYDRGWPESEDYEVLMGDY
jgi:hypothetical protein